jgi:hypothetical protein
MHELLRLLAKALKTAPEKGCHVAHRVQSLWACNLDLKRRARGVDLGRGRRRPYPVCRDCLTVKEAEARAFLVGTTRKKRSVQSGATVMRRPYLITRPVIAAPFVLGFSQVTPFW